MDLHPDILKELVAVFRGELDERLAEITEGLLVLEKGGDRPEEVFDAIFRAAHNIKGAARGVGITDIAELSHGLESIFSALKRGESSVSPEVIDLCLFTLDRMRDLMVVFASEEEIQFDLDGLRDQLGRAAAGAPFSPVVREDVPTGTAAGDERLRVATGKLDRLAAQAEELQVSRLQGDDHLEVVRQLASTVEQLVKVWGPAARAVRSQAELPSEVRSLFVEGTESVSLLRDLSARLHREMRTTNSRLAAHVNGIQEELRLMRLVPASTVLRPLERTVRDIVRQVGKRAHLVIDGDRIEMDRAVLDGLRDPLLHLLRNAIDHGIESPESRRAVGKTEEGQIVIRLVGEDGGITLRVSDDGGGIDVEAVARAALMKGLVPEDELVEMDEQEVLELIFRPGFSSRDTVTDISGRGVGLDVVRANLQGIKGSVRVESELGRGTEFILRVPLTLSSEHGLIVSAGETMYAIPATAVDRVLMVERREVVEVEASQAILVEGRPIPLRDLAVVLDGASGQEANEALFSVVMVGSGWNLVAFRVDEVIGEREIVIKGLRPPLASVRNITGGTLTGSGEVILVLNPRELIDSALSRGSRRVVAGATDASAEPAHILVVDDSITTRTLERSILENKGYRVTVAVNGKEAWDLVQANEYDLVVSDIEMPLMTGLELAERIKSHAELRRLPIIIVSSLASEAHRQRGVEVGADAYLVKSEFETQSLLELVGQLL